MHNIKFYGLSTCIHCKNAMQYLNEKGVEYDKTMVDLLDGDEYEHAIEAVRKLNPALSFPTIVVDGETVVGFNKDKLEKLLN